LIKFYNNRELAEKFQINPAKWKRWSREFLPPDPLGGIQSGYARQYHPDQVFTVYFGGYLVAHLKFTIPEAKQILADLQRWLHSNGFCFNGNKVDFKTGAVKRVGKQYRLFIVRPEPDGPSNGELDYRIEEILDRRRIQHEGRTIIQEQWVDAFQCGTKNSDFIATSAVMLNITNFMKDFVKKLGQAPGRYPALATQAASLKPQVSSCKSQAASFKLKAASRKA
jgi:hypothetical protein